MQHIAGERRSEECWMTSALECLETPDLEEMQCLPFITMNRATVGTTTHWMLMLSLGRMVQGTKASLSTSTFANSPFSAPSISTQSSHKHTASTSSKRGCLEAFKVETDARESWMVELASKQQDYKVASLAVKSRRWKLQHLGA